MGDASWVAFDSQRVGRRWNRACSGRRTDAQGQELIGIGARLRGVGVRRTGLVEPPSSFSLGFVEPPAGFSVRAFPGRRGALTMIGPSLLGGAGPGQSKGFRGLCELGPQGISPFAISLRGGLFFLGKSHAFRLSLEPRLDPRRYHGGGLRSRRCRAGVRLLHARQDCRRAASDRDDGKEVHEETDDGAHVAPTLRGSPKFRIAALWRFWTRLCGNMLRSGPLNCSGHDSYWSVALRAGRWVGAVAYPIVIRRLRLSGSPLTNPGVANRKPAGAGCD